jgi:hypothetical protein
MIYFISFSNGGVGGEGRGGGDERVYQVFERHLNALEVEVGDEHDEKKNRCKVQSLKKANRKVRKSPRLGLFKQSQE